MKFKALAYAMSIALCVGFCGSQKAHSQQNNISVGTSSGARFPVAHEHSGSWCLGYLYISADGLKYQAVEPKEDLGHSFQVSRSEIQGIRKWFFLNQSLNAVEIQTSRATYHFWLLQNETDIESGRPYTWNPPDAAPADILIAAAQAQSVTAGPDVRATTVPPTSKGPALAGTAADNPGQRFPVAHAHFGSWCVGYLSLASDSIRYDVVWPDRDKAHSFHLLRSDMTTVRQWMFGNQAINAVEIRTAHATYHFYLMQSEADLRQDRHPKWRPTEAAASSTLIAALQGAARPTSPGLAAIATPAAATVLSQPSASLSSSSLSSSSLTNLATRGYAGLRGNTLNASGEKGVLVTYVEPNGPGSTAGLEQGDVIEEINGQPITGWSDFEQKTGITKGTKGWGMPPGTTVELRVNRGGQLRELSVTLGQIPDVAGTSATSSNHAAGSPAFSNNPAAGSPAAATLPGRLSGIYRANVKEGTDPSDTLAAGDPAAKTPSYSYLVFFPSGRVKKGLAYSGLDGFNDEFQMSGAVRSGGNTATQWGMYQLSGNGGMIRFASANGFGRSGPQQQLISGLNGEIWNITLYPDRLQIHGDTYFLMDSGKGRRLEGTYKPMGDPTQPGIAFTRDGEFVDQGILNTGAMANIRYGGGTGVAIAYEAPHGGRGTYRLSNYTLTLNYANSAPALLFYLDPSASNGNLQNVYINNTRYQRVQ